MFKTRSKTPIPPVQSSSNPKDASPQEKKSSPPTKKQRADSTLNSGKPPQPPEAAGLPADNEQAPPQRRFRIFSFLTHAPWMASMLFHAGVILLLALIFMNPALRQEHVIATSLDEDRSEEELVEQAVENLDPLTIEDVNSEAPSSLQAMPEVQTPEVAAQAIADLTNEARETVKVDIPGSLIEGMPSAGDWMKYVGRGSGSDTRAVVDGYGSAMDRLTEEILQMLESSPVLVVWVFDQSESMKDDQKNIRDRLVRVFDELAASGKTENRALLNSVVSYGEGYRSHTPAPTDDIKAVKKAIDAVPVDPSGKEMTCQAITQAVRQNYPACAKGKRKMAVVLVTDESGEIADTKQHLETAVATAKQADSRVYVLGREAAFGTPFASVRWQHPETKSNFMLQINRGAETAFEGVLQEDPFGSDHSTVASGFPPYAQSRLTQETGGLFFLLPSDDNAAFNRENRSDALKAMRQYKPDLRAAALIDQDHNQSPLRVSIRRIVHTLNRSSRSGGVQRLTTWFSHDGFVQSIQRARENAANYQQVLVEAEETLRKLASQREAESEPRWRANYDLLLAQVVSDQARVAAYRDVLKKAANNRPKAPANPDPKRTFSGWHFSRRSTVSSNSKIEEAEKLFDQVIARYPGTPWSVRAQRCRGRSYGGEIRPSFSSPGTRVELPSL